MRLDKFLKVSRLIKRRTVANEACDAGRVMVNDRPAKASVNVKEGDIIEIQFGTKKFWQNPTALLEYRVIPLMISVVKIGDELSAAALTRGLGGLKHRTSIAAIGFTAYDLIIALLSAGLLVWSIL